MGSIRRTFLGVVAALSLAGPLAGPALAAGKTVGVSWRHFQEERWRIDEAGIKSALDKAGYHLCQRRRAGRSAEAAHRHRGPARARVRRADHPRPRTARRSCRPSRRPRPRASRPSPTTCRSTTADTLFVSFDNVAVGHLMAEAMVKAKANGNWVLIEGDAVDGHRRPLPQRPDGGPEAADRQGRHQDRRAAEHRRTGSPTSPSRPWSRS